MTDIELLKAANDLLRSAYAIALRQGANTYWDGFRRAVEQALLDQSAKLNKTDFLDAAVCTARTYRIRTADDADDGGYGGYKP